MMNHPEKSYDDMTVEELQQELQEAFLDTDIIDEPLNDELEKMREALNKKRPVDYLYTPEESWERFLEDKADELSVPIVPQEEPATRPIKVRAARSRSVPALLRRVLIAAVVVVLLAGAALAADSLGLWAWVPRWNALAGRYEPAAMEVEAEGPISAALAELGITEPVYPARLPKGFVLTESLISDDPLILMEQYARGEQRLSVTISPIKQVHRAVYTQIGQEPQEYDSGELIHYFFANEGTVTAYWYTDNYSTTISGDFPREELKRIVNSLYEAEKGGESP